MDTTARSTRTRTDPTSVDQFFDRYATALLARDEKTIGELYAVPALIVFPGQSLPVSDRAQTEQFFAASWGQYDGVDSLTFRATVLAEGPASIWADVTWIHSGADQERFCYQLVPTDAGATGHQIAVLTPLPLETPRDPQK